jgi:hypothetical protein
VVPDAYDRLGLQRPVLPEMGELVRWEPTPGRVHFARVVAYATNMRSEVVALMVSRGELTESETWPLAETTVVDLTVPAQMLEWMHSGS